MSELLELLSVPECLGAEPTCGLDRVRSDFYDVPCEQLARNLLGCTLVRRLESGKTLKGKIVETECYLGGEDKASHSYDGRMTERNLPMYMRPGTCYVYLTYGMYHCFNISSRGPGAAVLLRAIDPSEGLDGMLALRLSAKKGHKKDDRPLPAFQLCNGPAKLCASFAIDKASCNRRDLARWDGMWVEDDGLPTREHEVVETSRVGIDGAGVEWASKLLRFYVADNKAVSRRDKVKEKEMRDVARLLT